MITIFLKFSSELEAQQTLIAFGAGPSEGEGFSSYGSGLYENIRYDYVVVNSNGIIYKTINDVTAPIDGYHVNILWNGQESDIPDFGNIRIYPKTPECVFAL